MTLDALTLFVAVAQRLSFAAVAKERDMDPSSVSRLISDLEAELGLRLFQRTTRSMTLTEAGALYLARVEPLIEEMHRAHEAAAQITGSPRGLLRLTASVTFGQKCIIPLLPAFRARYPDLQLDCLFTDANVDLVADRIDLAVRLAPAIEGDLIAAKLMDICYQVVASPAYLASHSQITRPADLLAHRVLLFAIKAFRQKWLFKDSSGRTEHIAIEGDLTLTPAGSLLTAAQAGLGPALLPDWLVRDALADGSLINVLPHHAATATTFDTAAWLIYPSRSFLPNKVRVMADFLRENLGGG